MDEAQKEAWERALANARSLGPESSTEEIERVMDPLVESGLADSHVDPETGRKRYVLKPAVAMAWREISR